MKVVRAPLRVSLFGGGTDRTAYCSRYGSTIVSFAIDRYLYVVWNDRPTGGCRLSYSEVEELDTLWEAQHTLVRAAAQRFGIKEPCTLTIVSDVPKGIGLGSSSALSVSLCKLAGPQEKWPWAAVHLEQSVSPQVGWQDHMPAFFGGFRIYRMREGSMRTYGLPQTYTDIVNRYGMLLYTGLTRDAAAVLKQWTTTETLHRIRELAEWEVAEMLAPGIDPEERRIRLGNALAETWRLKKSIPGVCGDGLKAQYRAALNSGALAGKLCGAGAGGCWFFLVPPEKREAVVKAVGLREIPFQVSEKGVEGWEL